MKGFLFNGLFTPYHIAPNEVFNSSPMELISIPLCHIISAAKTQISALILTVLNCIRKVLGTGQLQLYSHRNPHIHDLSRLFWISSMVILGLLLIPRQPQSLSGCCNTISIVRLGLQLTPNSPQYHGISRLF